MFKAISNAKSKVSSIIDNTKDKFNNVADITRDEYNKIKGPVSEYAAQNFGQSNANDYLKYHDMSSPDYLPCFRTAINGKYAEQLDHPADKAFGNVGDTTNQMLEIARAYPEWTANALTICLAEKKAVDGQAANAKISSPNASAINKNIPNIDPFDKRLGRLNISDDGNPKIRTPFSAKYAETATSGFFSKEKFLKDSDYEKKNEEITRIQKAQKLLQENTMHIGVPALTNTYALTKLYGSEGGSKLINKRGDRKWYEVDQAWGTGVSNLAGFSSIPSTSSLISWGNADPYGRLPYHFTDFAFSKYWNKIENNRLITLRRYGAPILDNLKFPGMDGATTADKTTSKVSFPPMASAITYFGEETNNNLSNLLKFTSGMNWDEATADVWTVGAESTPDSTSGPTGLFKSIGTLSKMLNVAQGNFDSQLLMNKGGLPPDPYSDGPYENRVLGPVNRIDSVKKRKAGLSFEWSGLNLVFEYVARPIGGINPKAVLLDILSNFLVIGSASAVFFGGQHRFMANPAIYPFLGGEAGIESWYNGDPIGYANQAVKSFVGNTSNKGSAVGGGGLDFFNALLGVGADGGLASLVSAAKNLVKPGGAASNIFKHEMIKKSAGTVPYLTGLKALLTGEPVGEWHVTIGNPLNPIAMIGNLICNGVEVEFGDELGPDDFPTEMKLTVKLDHGMPRDRDAIQSIFNRGMGRIYDLPDHFEGTADGQTAVDKNTQTSNETGTAAKSVGWLAGPSTTGSRSGPPIIRDPANTGNTSVWASVPFRAVSPTEDTLLDANGTFARSAYRSVDWLALKSLK